MESWQEAIAQSIVQLHEWNAWPFVQTGKHVSFGLVRIANIRPAVEMARFLAGRFPDAYVACYHSQDFTIQRHLKEKRLDFLLTRKNGNGHIEADAEIFERVSQSKSSFDVKFIVVATPVEEIGRDHDFDWAVIEPSSTQSIVQTAGRVNRHRLLRLTKPNVMILQFNLRKIRNDKIVFTRPGLETGDRRYNDHDLERLIDWNTLQVLDAGLRFREHPFARLDNENLAEAIENPLKVMCMESKLRDWMVEATYADYPLRDRAEIQQTWRINKDEDKFEVLVRTASGNRFVVRDDLVKYKKRVPNTWLAWTREELASFATDSGISFADAFLLTIPQYPNSDKQGFEWDEAFGATK